MNKFSVVFCLLLFSTNLLSKEEITFGFSDVINSELLKEEKTFYVYLPASYNSSKRNYPVVYVLDGDIHRLKAVVGVLEGLSTETLGNQTKEAIIVAIPNTNRSRDLTPTVLPEWTFQGRVLDSFEETGKASTFAAFLENELIPKIETEYRNTDQRVLIGESFGALFGGYLLIHDPSLFTDYLLIDPTSLWDNNYLNNAYASANIFDAPLTSNIYFAFANNSHLGEIGKTNYAWGNEFASKFVAKTSNSFFAKFNYFENETHGTVALLGWYNGFKALLPNTEE